MTIRFAPTPQEPSVAVAEDTGRDGPAAGDEAPAADGPETDHPAGRASVWPARIAAASSTAPSPAASPGTPVTAVTWALTGARHWLPRPAEPRRGPGPGPGRTTGWTTRWMTTRWMR